MATLNQLTDQVVSEITGYVRNQESLTYAVNAVSATDLTVTVDDTTAISKGIVEIDDELLYVKKSVASSGSLQILGTTSNPVGRAWRATTATSHVAGSIVRNNPIFPRSQVKRAINETIKGMNFPCLDNETFTFDGSTYAYEIPSTVIDITGVSWQLPDASGVWGIIKRWRMDTNYYNGTTTTQAIILNEAPKPGKSVRVQYTRYPTVIADSEELTVSGLPASCEDVVRLGAMYRLLTTIDPAKTTATSVESGAMDRYPNVTPGASTNAAKYVFQLYAVRLGEEIAKQQSFFLNTIQYSR